MQLGKSRFFILARGVLLDNGVTSPWDFVLSLTITWDKANKCELDKDQAPVPLQ